MVIPINRIQNDINIYQNNCFFTETTRLSCTRYLERDSYIYSFYSILNISATQGTWYILFIYRVLYIKYLTHLPHSAAHMRQWTRTTLVQIMACRLFGAKPLSKPVIVNWTLENKLQWNLNQNTKLFIHDKHLKMSSSNRRPFCPGGGGRWLTWKMIGSNFYCLIAQAPKTS